MTLKGPGLLGLPTHRGRKHMLSRKRHGSLCGCHDRAGRVVAGQTGQDLWRALQESAMQRAFHKVLLD